MPKEYFSIDKITPLKEVKPGGKIHVIGVAGVAMAQMAILLTKRGFQVSGSDKEFYEPMGSLLRNSAVKISQGYKAENVSNDIDLVLIGNAVSYGHPEVSVVEERNLPYTCFPALLSQLIIEGRHSIVVTGTHGKSTTSAMIASVLNKIGEKPSYFIGGVVRDLKESLCEGKGRFSVVEGDEYDSAFFAKVPKFSFYKPDTAIINAIEYDHADIYPNLDAVKEEFNKLTVLLPKTGKLIVCTDFKNIKELLPKWRERLTCKIITFGKEAGADYLIKNRRQNGAIQNIEVFEPNGERVEIKIPLIGEYNARNALASFIALSSNGISKQKILDALLDFKSVKRRQEILLSNDKVTLIEDFAHHPTSVRETIEAVKEAYPDKKIWALFEPRSNTSRRKVFEQEYIDALALADHALILDVKERGEIDKGQELMDVANICAVLKSKNLSAQSFSEPFSDVAKLEAHVINNMKSQDVIIIMSNGSFGGIASSLKDKFLKGN